LSKNEEFNEYMWIWLKLFEKAEINKLIRYIIEEDKDLHFKDCLL